METQTQDQTSLTSDLSPTAPKKKADPVTLASPHLYDLTARALADRAEVLKKLAKDARAEGYTRQAMDFEADAAAIDAVLLPQVRMQREFPLVDGEKFEKACGDALAGIVRQAFTGLDEPKTKITKEMLDRRRDNLVRALGGKVATYARAIASAAYTHGYQVRTTSEDVIAAGELTALGGNGARGD